MRKKIIPILCFFPSLICHASDKPYDIQNLLIELQQQRNDFFEISDIYFEDTESMSGSERKRIFYEIEDLKRKGMQLINEAYDLRWKIPDINAQKIFEAAIADCYYGVKYGGASLVTVCIACITELANAVCQKCADYKYGETLIKAAKMKFKRAEELEYKLWTDPDPHDWM
jgi:hypothetical protein